MTPQQQVEAQRPCQTWADHVWKGRKFLEIGKHPTMGRYRRFRVRCGRCGHAATETEWLDVLGRRAAGQ